MSFLHEVDLSNAAQLAITRDLELRRKDQRAAERFLGYAYRGGADLVLQHGRFYKGRQIPDQYAGLIGEPNRCYVNAYEACQANPELRYCEGYMTAGFGVPISHGWCIAPDGGVVEVTIPTDPEQLGRFISEVRMAFMPPPRWAYYGAIFDAQLVLAHHKALGLPMLDRSRGELSTKGAAMLGIGEDDEQLFPILSVPYDPNRTEVP